MYIMGGPQEDTTVDILGVDHVNARGRSSWKGDAWHLVKTYGKHRGRVEVGWLTLNRVQFTSQGIRCLFRVGSLAPLSNKESRYTSTQVSYLDCFGQVCSRTLKQHQLRSDAARHVKARRKIREKARGSSYHIVDKAISLRSG